VTPRLDSALSYYTSRHSFQAAKGFVEPPFKLSNAAAVKYLFRQLSEAPKRGEYIACQLALHMEEKPWEDNDEDEDDDE